MKKVKVLVVIGWFLALNGITKYYPNSQTGYLQKSRYLQTYSIIHNVLMICGLPLLFLDNLSDEPVIMIQMSSNWINYGNWLYIILYTMVILTTIYCTHILQLPIQRNIVKLERLNDVEELPSTDQSYIYSLLYRKLFLICFQFVVIISFECTRLYNMNTFKRLCVFSKFWGDIMTTAISLLMYDILWRICYCGMHLQFQLKKLLSGRAKIKEILRIFDKIHSLIDACNEFRESFRFLMLWYSMGVLCTDVLSLYFLIRQVVVPPDLGVAFFTVLLFVICSFTELYVFNNLNSTVADLIPNTLAVLKQSLPQNHRVERAISWMTLQLSCRSTEIHIFGMVTFNQRLTFVFITQIILNTLYMIQNDYNIIM